MMFCTTCGEVVPDGVSNCPQCGASLPDKTNEQAVIYASQSENEILPQIKPTKKAGGKATIGIIAIMCVIVIAFVANYASKANLKKTLVKEWYDTDGSIVKVLDIRDDYIEYRLETGYLWLDTSLGTFEWMPAGKDKIKIKRFSDEFELFTVELSDDKNTLTISPAITSVASSETWYHVDFD